jgi:hypothetical protein
MRIATGQQGLSHGELDRRRVRSKRDSVERANANIEKIDAARARKGP